MYHAEVVTKESTHEFLYYTLYPMGELMFFFLDEYGYEFKAFNQSSIQQLNCKKVNVN